MEATHFIELYSGTMDTVEPWSTPIDTINRLQHRLNETALYEYIETIAVWRIKETDVPLQERLNERWLKKMYSQPLRIERRTTTYTNTENFQVI
jgi:hypothetical protein